MFLQMRQEEEEEDDDEDEEDDNSPGDNYPMMSFSMILESMDPQQAMAVKSQMNNMSEE
jgi:hypothetical protein